MNAFMNALHKRVVDNVREVWRHWSLWFGAVGTAFVSWFITSPETAIAAWAMIPADIKAMLPPQFVGYIGIGLCGLALLAKFVKQLNLPSNKRNETL